MYKGYKVGQGSIEINLLQFGYDTIFLGEVIIENLLMIKAS